MRLRGLVEVCCSGRFWLGTVVWVEMWAGCRVGGRVPRVLGCRGRGFVSAGPGCGAEPGERGREVLGPGPVLVEVQGGDAGGAGEFGGDGADAVAERGGFGSGEVAGEAERLGPGEQVRGGEGEFQPGF